MQLKGGEKDKKKVVTVHLKSLWSKLDLYEMQKEILFNFKSLLKRWLCYALLFIIIPIRINMKSNFIRSLNFSLQIASFMAGVDTLYSGNE